MNASYGQFCPVAKAAEVLCQRWALLVVREVLGGSTRFGELQRGLPGCPPATLAKRLRELEAAGVLVRTGSGAATTYAATEAATELDPILDGFGRWGQRWARSTYGPDELDAEMLLWDMRRYLDPAGLGAATGTGVRVVELRITSPGARDRRFWMVVDGTAVDLCLIDPDRSVDVVLEADLQALTRVWMGDTRFADAAAARTLRTSGAPGMVTALPTWIGSHPVLGGVAAAR